MVQLLPRENQAVAPREDSISATRKKWWFFLYFPFISYPDDRPTSHSLSSPRNLMTEVQRTLTQCTQSWSNSSRLLLLHFQPLHPRTTSAVCTPVSVTVHITKDGSMLPWLRKF
jgi:hypothetical protein